MNSVYRQNHATHAGKILQTVRLDAGLSQTELAYRAGISSSYMSLIELGKRAVSLLIFMQICAGLKIKPSTLLKQIEDHVSA
jgi:transcriptional regulator with XRE-family HTH domain